MEGRKGEKMRGFRGPSRERGAELQREKKKKGEEREFRVGPKIRRQEMGGEEHGEISAEEGRKYWCGRKKSSGEVTLHRDMENYY